MANVRVRFLLVALGLAAQLLGSSAPAADHGRVSTQLAVSGAVQRPGTYDLAALQALPAETQTQGDKVYTGVGLWNFLNGTIGLKGLPGAKHPSLTMYVVATGSDGYRVAFALAELDPDFGDQPDLIAYAVGGSGLGPGGFARLVVPNDRMGGRFVANLVGLEVFTLPASP
jgi:DMSO/TMAO reductase YedYZ molybdopterin-dependent catalytic subunit